MLVVDGRMTPLDAANFVFDENNLALPWRMATGDGRIDLGFLPEAQHVERANALVVATRFSQVMGTFSGVVRTRDGETIVVRDLPGFVEDHYAKW
jgi:hypothetical protein